MPDRLVDRYVKRERDKEKNNSIREGRILKDEVRMYLNDYNTP